MIATRYLHAVLTIIALELGWIAFTHMPAATAQAQPQVQRVVITGFDLDGPINVQVVSPVKVEADTPLKVENVGATPSARPGL
jgi:hypothetical protein